MANLKNTNIDNNLELPSGTTGQRPSSPQEGQIRYNTDLAVTEFYNGSNWRPLSDTHAEATGGTVVDTDIGGVPYRIHYFTETGTDTLTVTNPGEVEYLIVAGGGGGGSQTAASAGGGGAGGVLTGKTSVSAQPYTISVGSGGQPGASGDFRGESGENSTAFGLTAIGGGGGGGGQTRSNALDGGSGGGGGESNGDGGSGTQGQGNNGSDGSEGGNFSGAGGGAGSAAGRNGNINAGEGISNLITGSLQFYAGGGAGGNFVAPETPGKPGLGGGGESLDDANSPNGAPGTPNTGGGGGGTTINTNGRGGAGGSGIVIIRYPRNSGLDSEPDETRPSFQPYNYARDVRPIVARDGLVLDLDAANPLSYPGTGITWTDLSRNGNNGTLVNGVGYTNQNLGGLVFDGVNDEVNCGNSTLLKPKFITVESWIKHTNPSQGLSFICGVGNTGPLGYWLAFRPSSNALRFSLRTVDETGAQFTTASLPFSITNTIGHFVGTYDGVEVKMYYNGELVFTDTASGNIEYSSIETESFEVGDLGFGGNTSDRFWTGNIYGVKIYNRALSESEITQNFNATRGRYGI